VTALAQVAEEFDGWAPELTALITDGETDPAQSSPNGHLCKAAISSLMMIEAFFERLIARSKAVARP
jgi:hypothetical protein